MFCNLAARNSNIFAKGSPGFSGFNSYIGLTSITFNDGSPLKSDNGTSMHEFT